MIGFKNVCKHSLWLGFERFW